MTKINPTAPRQQYQTSQNHLGSRIWMVLLGLSLCFMGTVGGVYLYLSFQKARRCDDWLKRPATVIVSTIDNSGRTQHNDMNYRLEVHYRYTVEGKKYISSKVKLLPIAKRDQRKIKAWKKRYSAGDEVTCYVKPTDPSLAILVKPSKAAIYSIWFPSLLVIFGFRLILGSFSNKAGG